MSANGRPEGASSALTVLLIDDNPTVTQAMAIAFRMAGHRLDSAAGPEAAFSMLALRRYDAILLDMNFTAGESSGEEGLACLRRIVAEDAGACVIVITAHSGIRIAVAAMQAGACDFMMKPWRNAELIAKVEAAAARGAMAASMPATPAPVAAEPVLRGLVEQGQPASALVAAGFSPVLVADVWRRVRAGGYNRPRAAPGLTLGRGPDRAYPFIPDQTDRIP